MDRIIVSMKDGEVQVFSDTPVEVVVVDWSPNEGEPAAQALTLSQNHYEAGLVRVTQTESVSEDQMESDVQSAVAAFCEPPTSGPG